MSAPICTVPASMANAPNHSTATLDTFMMSITTGNTSANRRPALTAVPVTSALARSKRAVSRSSRTNARTTRMPVSCSRSTLLTVSRRACISRKSGTMRLTMNPMTMSITGIATTRIHDSPTSWRSAMMTPPIARIGAETSSVHVVSTRICTCCTSLVVRVISDGAPKRETSRSENSPTRTKIASRRSRPNAMAAFDPK